jgi:hypothetical protein
MATTDNAVSTTPLLSSNPDRTQYDAIWNTLTENDRESIRKMVAKDLVFHAGEDIHQRNRYRRMADTAEVCAKVLAGLCSILAFSASAFPDQNRMLSFLAGIVGTVGVVCSGWAHYASGESDERLNRLNVILKGVGLSPLPGDSESKAEVPAADGSQGPV